MSDDYDRNGWSDVFPKGISVPHLSAGQLFLKGDPLAYKNSVGMDEKQSNPSLPLASGVCVAWCSSSLSAFDLHWEFLR